jgi:hypothetical protein
LIVIGGQGLVGRSLSRYTRGANTQVIIIIIVRMHTHLWRGLGTAQRLLRSHRGRVLSGEAHRLAQRQGKHLTFWTNAATRSRPRVAFSAMLASFAADTERVLPLRSCSGREFFSAASKEALP